MAEQLRDALAVPPLPDRLEADDRRELEGVLCTHLFHSFAGRAHPLTVRKLLDDLPVGATVLDPFVGSGTVLVEATLHGARGIGCDISDLALRLSRFKATLLPPAMSRALVDRARAVGTASAERVKARQRPTQTWDKPQFYPPHVYLELCGLRAEVEAIVRRDPPLGEALLLVFSSIVVKASRQRSETNPTPVERHIGRGQATRWFVAKAEEVARLHAAMWDQAMQLRADHAAAEKSNPPTEKPTTGAAKIEPPWCVKGDARTLLSDAQALPLWDGSVDRIVTSPPYLGTYDYVDHHVRRYPWLGIDPTPIERGEMAARRHGRERALADLCAAHQNDTNRWVTGAARLLRTGGQMHVLVGDSLVQGEVIRGDVPIRRAAEAAGLRFVARVAAERPHFWTGAERGPDAEDAPSAPLLAPRLEHLMVFVRGGH